MMIKKLGKKKLISIGTVTVIAVGVVLTGVKVNADRQYQDSVNQAIIVINNNNKILVSLESELQSYYDDSNMEFLVSKISSVDVEKFEKKIAEFYKNKPSFEVRSQELDKNIMVILDDTTKLQREAKLLKVKLTTQESLNSLFQKEKSLDGPMIKENLVIVDDLVSSQLDKFNEIGTLSIEFDNAVNEIVTNAKGQLSQIQKATESVDKLFKDKKVIEKVDDIALKSAQNEMKKIKNEKAKKVQEARLKQVTNEVTKQKKAQAEAIAKGNGGTVREDGNGGFIVETNNPQIAEGDNWAGGTDAPYQADNSMGTANNSGSGTTYTPPANNGGGTGYTPPTNNGGGGTTTPPTSGGGATTPPTTGGGWSGNVDQTEGGTVGGGIDNGGSGDNTWTGGGFDGSGIPDWQ